MYNLIYIFSIFYISKLFWKIYEFRKTKHDKIPISMNTAGHSVTDNYYREKQRALKSQKSYMKTYEHPTWGNVTATWGLPMTPSGLLVSLYTSMVLATDLWIMKAFPSGLQHTWTAKSNSMLPRTLLCSRSSKSLVVQISTVLSVIKGLSVISVIHKTSMI